MSKVDVLTLNYNDAETTISFVNSVRTYEQIGVVLVIDNNSTDDSFQRLSHELASFDNVEVVSTGHNGGYGAGNNFGIRYLCEKFGSEFILLSNPDVIVEEKAIVSMKHFLQNNLDFAMVAPVMMDPNGVKQSHTAVDIPTVWQYILSMEWIWNKYVAPFRYRNLFDTSDAYKLVGAVSGSMFMMNADHMIKHGMYDENVFLYCEEVTLGLKLKKNKLKTALLLSETFVHNHSVSISKSYKSMYKRHSLLLKSKLYVIKNYYNANWLQFGFAKFISLISRVEMLMLSVLRCR